MRITNLGLSASFLGLFVFVFEVFLVVLVRCVFSTPMAAHMKNKRTIPELRDRLFEASDEYGIPELAEIAQEMFRRSPKKRAKTKSQKMTPELAQEIREYAEKHPDLHDQEIADIFDVNHGRVSEARNNDI